MTEEEILVRKLNFLRKDAISAYDSNQKFALQIQIEELEKQLVEIRKKNISVSSPLEETERNKKQTKKKIFTLQNSFLKKGLIVSVVSLAFMIAIYYIFKDETPKYTFYTVEGKIADQNNKPILNAEIRVNNKIGFTDISDGNFIISGVPIGKDKKIELVIEYGKLSIDTLIDSNQYDIRGNKVDILHTLKIKLEENNKGYHD